MSSSGSDGDVLGSALRASSLNDRAVFVISVAAELAGVHPQTLRAYERKGLLHPKRTTANSRRYSERDVARLQEILELTGQGVNLAGVRRVMELEQRVDDLQAEIEGLKGALQATTRRHAEELDQARRGGRRDLVAVRSQGALVVYQSRGVPLAEVVPPSLTHVQGGRSGERWNES